MKTPSPHRPQKRHPSTPLSPLARRDHTRRRLDVENTTITITTTTNATATSNSNSTSALNVTNTSTLSTVSPTRRLALQNLQLTRLSQLVQFLETERKLS
jgi:mRNA-degrading endonuclease toxin of MazEF toxin-antitoxin module